MPTFAHSKLSVVKLDNAAGALQTISTYVNKFSLNRKLDQNKITCFGATDHAYMTGFGDGECTIGGPWSRELHTHMSAVFAAMKAGTLTSVSVEYGPEGSDSGDTKQTAELIITEYSGAEADVENPQEYTAKFMVTGGITDASY